MIRPSPTITQPQRYCRGGFPPCAQNGYALWVLFARSDTICPLLTGQCNFTTNYNTMDGTKRSSIKIGAHVNVVQKHDQRSGKLTEGVVARILTKSATHPHGIKVMLEDGVVGRVKAVL